jgi:GNAT superfamily N-acetyltransferase
MGAPPAGTGLLFGWWEPPDGSEPRGAFLHDPAVPLLIAGRAPEMAAALAGTLAKMGRPVCGVDGPIEAADAFAAAWSHREGASIRMHKQCRVYRLAGGPDGMGTVGGTPGAAGTWATGGAGGPGGPGTARTAFPAAPANGEAGAWAPPAPTGMLRVATVADRALIVEWLTAFAAEAAERIGSPQEMADDLIGYGGAVLWESPQRAFRIREAAQHLAGAHHRETSHRDAAAQNGEPVYQPVAMAALTRPVAGTVRISVVYTAPDRRRNGYAAALMYAASRAVLEGIAPRAEPGAGPRAGSQVVMITDTNRPNRGVARLGYQLVGERAVLRFGPPTGPLPGVRTTGPMPRLPTGPLPRFRR